MSRQAVMVAFTVSAVNIPLAVILCLLGVNVAGYAILLIGTTCIWGIACGVITL